MKLNVVLGAAVFAGAITGAGSSWAGDKPAPTTAGPASKAQHEHAGKEAKDPAKDATKAAKKDTPADVKSNAAAKPGADGAKSAPEGADGKPEKGTVGDAAAAPAGADPAAALAARNAARDAYKQLLTERKNAREAALAGKSGSDAQKAAAEVNAQYESKLRELRSKLFAASHPELSAEARTARDERLTKLTDKARTDRISKRKASLGALEKAYGKKLQNAWFASELRGHAWRLARLERLLAIAEASERPDVVAKLKELQAKEQKLHASRMEKLAKTVPPEATDAAKPAVAAPGAAAAAAPAAVPAAAAAAKPASAPGAAPQTTTPSAAKGDKK